MPRFYLLPSESACAEPVLRGGEARHALRVLRLREGDALTVLDGAGGEMNCRIGVVSREEASLEVTARKRHGPPACAVTLFQAVPKGRGMEEIIEKAVELGVNRVVPLLTERCVVRLDAAERGARQTKWRQAAIEAIKQCGQPWLPEIAAPMTLTEALALRDGGELKLLAALQPDARPPRSVFAEARSASGRAPSSVAVWVGPEGDFTPGEAAAIRASGAVPITLGPLVLRVETATICALSIIGCETWPEDAPRPVFNP